MWVFGEEIVFFYCLSYYFVVGVEGVFGISEVVGRWVGSGF